MLASRSDRHLGGASDVAIDISITMKPETKAVPELSTKIVTGLHDKDIKLDSSSVDCDRGKSYPHVKAVLHEHHDLAFKIWASEPAPSMNSWLLET